MDELLNYRTGSENILECEACLYLNEACPYHAGYLDGFRAGYDILTTHIMEIENGL